MLEAYVVITLGALGYLLNSMNKTVKSTTLSINKKETPSMNTIYDSQYFTDADNIEKTRAAKEYNKSLDPASTNVISKNYALDKPKKIKSISGQYIATEEFTHNNMVPFFGSHVRQNLDENSNRIVLENHTGATDLKKNKCEVKSFYDKKKDNIYGSQNTNDYYKDHIVAPVSRNNEFPIPQQHVGPGLNRGYTSEGVGGFQQYDAQEYIKEKTVDELRIASKPKETYEGRILPPTLPAGKRGSVGEFAKNRVETFFEQTPDMYLKTTASTLKQSQIPEFNVKSTNRIDTEKEYTGGAYINRARQADPSVKPTVRQQFKEYGIRNALLNMLGIGEKDDYGKANIIVYNNERDLTTTRTYQGNVQSLVKAIVAPLEDLIKITKKQEAVNNPREFGHMAPQMPQKPTMYDPNDVARTTIKETNVHEVMLGNLKPAGPEKLTMYDPNDVARTTIKETLIHDEIGTGTLTGPKELYVYDPEEIAKATIRETLDRDDYELNIAPGVYKGTVYDPEDIARKTMKETLIDGERYGNTETYAKGGAYETNDMEAKQTQKSFLSDIEYFGVGTRDKGEGYSTNDTTAKQTQKAFLSDYEYYGGAESATEKKMMSYDNMENAHVSENKEVTLFGREPKGSGVKSFNNNINMKFKKPACDIASERKTYTSDRVYNDTPTLKDTTITKNRMSVDLDIGDRLDVSLLDALKSNPYSRTIGSVG